MATRYLDHGAYAAYAAVPTWGVPQEGDGLAKAASTAAAIAFISFSATPTSGTVSVMGVAVTLTSVLSQASADVSANNLASSINATATAVASGVSNSTPQLRNLVYARGPSAGAPAGTCQIMARVGAAGLNYASNNACLITTTFNNVSSSAGNHQFAGGASGCYGYWSNDTTIWPQALTTLTYGFISATQKPLAGYPNAGDWVKIRSGKTIAPATAVNTTITLVTGGTAAAPVLFEFDDGTEWTADAPDPKFIWVPKVDSGGTLIMGTGSGVSIMRGKRYSDGSYSVTFGLSGTNASADTWRLGCAVPVCRWEGIHWDCVTYNVTGGTGGVQVGPGGFGQASANAFGGFFECKLTHKRATPFVSVGFNSNQFNFNMYSCVLSNAGAVVKNDGVFAWTQANAVVGMTNTRFEDFVVGSALFTGTNGVVGASSSNATAQLIMKDTSWGNVTARGPYGGSSTQPTLTPNQHMIFAGSSIESQDFLMDTKLGCFEWNSSRSQPTLNAKLKDGTTPMSLRFVSSTQAGKISPLVPLESPRLIKKNTLANGQRTFTLNFCLEENLTWNKSLIWMRVEYTDTSGVQRLIDTWDFQAGALTADTSTWSQEASGKVTFVDGGTLNHNKYKLTATSVTGKDVALGCEIGITLCICGVAGNLTQGGFVCPEILVS